MALRNTRSIARPKRFESMFYESLDTTALNRTGIFPNIFHGIESGPRRFVSGLIWVAGLTASLKNLILPSLKALLLISYEGMGCHLRREEKDCHGESFCPGMPQSFCVRTMSAWNHRLRPCRRDRGGSGMAGSPLSQSSTT